jgi:hypothetical protein
MSKKFFFFIVAGILFFTYSASAHQPNYVDKEKVIINNEPTISKAYYGELTGGPAIYQIVANSEFELYLNILSPDIPGASKDFNVIVKDEKLQEVAKVNIPPAEWNRWYEDFGGDWYWQGSETKVNLPPGTYTANVQNLPNTGKYVLAIGQIESFPPSKSLQILKELYLVKTSFLLEPWYGIYRGIIGRYLLYATISLILIIIVIVWLIIKRYRKKAEAVE